LLLLDGSPENEDKKQDYVSVLKKTMGDVLTNVGYIDAKCHSEILSRLEIQTEELPVLVYLNSKFEKYSRLIGRIEVVSVENFKAKVKANKGMWRFFERLEFKNKSCEKEHQRLKELEQAGYQMSEDEAAILEEIRLEEEQKKKESAAGTKESKKKRRKRRPKEEEDS
jgi:hypothetical protein